MRRVIENEYECMNARKDIARFLTAGVVVNATDCGIYYVLFHFLPYNLSKVLSFTCAGVVGYLLSKYWIFQQNRASNAEIGRYVLINSLALGLNVLTNKSILTARPGAVLLALTVATVLTGLFTFVCFKFWVFRVSLDCNTRPPVVL